MLTPASPVTRMNLDELVFSLVPDRGRLRWNSRHETEFFRRPASKRTRDRGQLLVFVPFLQKRLSRVVGPDKARKF
ncbi:hypothetical protein XA68_12413 [Ophiocordyceps unilateralis]|uniref:Uncharacterized protein n=1 Tax=Ophiocordyceps unilateralis TaxID=268505 RepID=A0A2A9PEI5_OPHUN|nr:hypothetical protein XA68_12413 [Ophiocordyceps unilateralis]